jgi:hypothetical protein
MNGLVVYLSPLLWTRIVRNVVWSTEQYTLHIHASLQPHLSVAFPAFQSGKRRKAEQGPSLFLAWPVYFVKLEKMKKTKKAEYKDGRKAV